VNLVVFVMDTPEDTSCATPTAKPYVVKMLDSWQHDGEQWTDRGTVLLIIYTGDYAPEIAANGILENLITADLRKKVLLGVIRKPLPGELLPNPVIRGLNSLLDAFMDKANETNSMQAQR
jgi:hypothetical protein